MGGLHRVGPPILRSPVLELREVLMSPVQQRPLLRLSDYEPIRLSILIGALQVNQQSQRHPCRCNEISPLLAASRFKKFTNKIGPVAGGILQKIIENVLDEAARKSIGL